MAFAIVQNQSQIKSGSSVPGSITLLGGAPGNGHLLIAIIGFSTSTVPSSLAINTAAWTQFQQIERPDFDDELYQIALYRYAQPGDLAALPAFCTAPSVHWGYTIYEISGVSGTWANDFLCATIGVQYDSNSSTPVTHALPTYPAIANGSLALTAVLVANNLESPTLSGSWVLDFSQFIAFPGYGSVSNAHRFMNAGDTIDGQWSQTGWEISSLFRGGVITIILSPSQPTTPYPRNVWSMLSATAGHPGVFTLPWTPKTGSLLLAYIGWADGTVANPAIDTGWTLFKAAVNVDDYIIGVYRYVQGGDTSTLPNLTTSGSAVYAVTVLELDGVSGTFSADHLADQAEVATPTAPTPWTTLPLTSSGTNQIGIINYAQFGTRGQLYVYSDDWKCANTITEFGHYGTISTFFNFYPTSGSTIQGTIHVSPLPNTAAYIESGILNGVPVVSKAYSYAEIWRLMPPGVVSISPSVSLQSAFASASVAAFTIASHNATLTLQSVTASPLANPITVSNIANPSVSLTHVSAGTSAAAISFGSSSLISTMIVANDAGGTAPAGAITHCFGHKFKEGDIVSGSYPDFRLRDGTVIPYSMTLPAYSFFSPTDGSLWDATFLLRMPNAIPASFTATVTTTNGSTTATMTSTASLAQYMGIFGANISIRTTGVASITNGTTFELTHAAVKTGSFTATFNGVLVDIKTHGTGPGTNSRSISDAPAIKNTAIYQNGGSGTTVCALSYASTNARADDYQFMSGAVGNCYVYPTAPYRSGGVSDQLLNAHMTIYVLQDQSAGLYGVREFIMPSNGFVDVAGNTWKSFSSVITDDGLGHSFDCYDVTTIGSTRNVNAATVGNNTFTLTSGTGFDGGELVQIGGPSPPSPLVVGNFYWVQKVGTSTFQLSNGSAQGTARIVPTTTGGTWTVTAYPWLVPFGTQTDAGPSARPRFFQGAGSVATDATLRIYKDPYYARSTGFYPSFDCEGADYQHSGTRPVASTKTATYFWGTSQPLGQRSLGGVSPEPTGYDLWSSNDFFNQTSTTKRISAMSPLIGCQFGIRLRSGQPATRGRVLPVNNGTNNSGVAYSGMPALSPMFNYGTTTGGTGFSPAGAKPSPTTALLPGFDAQTFDHWFAWFTGAVDNFREPHMLDWMIDDAAHAMFERGVTATPGVNNFSATQWKPGPTKFVSNAGYGVNRYCINMGASLQNGRYDAWAWRTQIHGASRIPTGYPEYSYLHDVADDGIANTVEMLANQATNPVAASTGFWLKGPSNFFFDGWQIAYYGMGMGPAGNYVKFNANALVGMNQTLKFCTNITKIMGYPLSYAQETPISAASHTPTGPLIADTSLLAGESLVLAWTNGSSVFTWTNFASNTLHTQGTYDFTKSIVGSADYFIFTTASPPSESIRTPGGGTEMVKYYVNPLSTSTCELHRLADFSDAPFVPTDTNQTTSWFRVVDYSTKLSFPAGYNVKDQFYNTMWDAVATGIAWGQTGGDPTGQSMWTTSWQACLTAGLVNQNTQGDGPNYLNTTL